MKTLQQNNSLDRLNILVILTDQLRRDALGVYGDPNVSTPNIDALANGGIRFTNACSTYPVCVPFRFTFMTGQYAHTRMVPSIEYTMSPAERTLADEFNDADYQTAYIGKWHLRGGMFHAPDYWKGYMENCGVPRIHQGRWQYWRGFELLNAPFDTYINIDDDPTPCRIEGYQTDVLTDLAIDFLDTGRDTNKPFCCVLSVEPPHPPFEAPKEYTKKWKNRKITLPANFMSGEPSYIRSVPNECWLSPREREKMLHERRMYYAMIENLDDNVGRLMKALKDSKLDENTIVMFVSDHGEMGGCHMLNEKQLPYEESIGIPLIVNGPGIRQGEILNELVCTEDLFPSVLGMVGLKPSDHMPGLDLTPYIKGEVDSLKREGVILEFVSELRPNQIFHQQTWRAFRTKDYKYVCKGTITRAEDWQFFDLKNDPYEMKNLINDVSYQSEIKKLRNQLIERMRETDDSFPQNIETLN